MPDTADRQEDEGRPEADFLLIKKLWRKEQHIRITPILLGALQTIVKSAERNQSACGQMTE